MLSTHSRGSVTYVTLQRPEVRNAFNDELIARLTDCFSNPVLGTRAIVISGEGPTFCAGGDLEWMKRAANYTSEENFEDAMRLGKLFQSIANCPIPVIAKVHGAAFGGGAGIVAACDIAIASPETKFAFSEVKLGLVPGTISSFVIPKIGAGNARALFVTGEAFSAEIALRIGLIHQVTEQLDETVNAKLKSILASGPGAIESAKKIVNDFPLPLSECARRLADARSSSEGKEGVAAFLEKRKASFVEALE